MTAVPERLPAKSQSMEGEEGGLGQPESDLARVVVNGGALAGAARLLWTLGARAVTFTVLSAARRVTFRVWRGPGGLVHVEADVIIGPTFTTVRRVRSVCGRDASGD